MQNPNEARVVRFTNIFDFDYTHAYGGIPYQLRAGETYLFPWVIGNHLATHLARQAMIRKAPVRDENDTDGRGGESKRSDRPLWDDTAIADLKNKIIKDAYTEERQAPVSEEQQLQRKVEELNKSFPGASDMGIAPSVEVGEPVVSNTPSAIYKDKAEVIAALTEKEIAHNPRSSKANLEKLLAEQPK